MVTWTDGKVAANGTNLHYHRTGGKKPAMLLLHGVTDNGLCWTRVALDLQDRYDIVMADARGHGRSDRLEPDYSVPLLAADAAGLIRGLGLHKPVVFGHSMGAITAAALAADYPELVSAIILEDPPLRNGPMPKPPAGFLEARRQENAALRAMSPEARIAWGTAQNPGWHPLEIEPWVESKTELDPAILTIIGKFDEYLWREAFERIQCPGLLITAEPATRAIVTPEVARQALELWENGEVVAIEGAAHCIHRDRYDETLAAVNAFLDRHAAR